MLCYITTILKLFAVWFGFDFSLVSKICAPKTLCATKLHFCSRLLLNVD